MGWTRTEFSWSCCKIGWQSGESEWLWEEWPQGFRRRQKRGGGNSNRTESRRRELGKKCCGCINSEPVSYVLIQVLETGVGMWNVNHTPNTVCRELCGYYDAERSGALPVPNSCVSGIEVVWPKSWAHRHPAKLASHQVQSSWAVSVYWVREFTSPSCYSTAGNACQFPWDGLKAPDAPQFLADQIHYKLSLGLCSSSLPSFRTVSCLPTGEGKAGAMNTIGWER